MCGVSAKAKRSVQSSANGMTPKSTAQRIAFSNIIRPVGRCVFDVTGA